MVLLSMCYSPSVTMPRTHRLRAELTTLGGGGPGVRGRMEREEAGEASTEERSGDLAQSRLF